MSRTKHVLLWVMAILYAFAGFNHLLNPDFYLAIMPPGLPNPEWLNVLSGLAEIILGVFILEPRVRVCAAWVSDTPATGLQAVHSPYRKVELS